MIWKIHKIEHVYTYCIAGLNYYLTLNWTTFKLNMNIFNEISFEIRNASSW